MALDRTKLTQDLGKLFRGDTAYPEHVEDAGPAWAAIYGAYATNAQAASGPTTTPVAASFNAAVTALGGAWRTMFVAARGAGPGYLAQLLPAMANALTAFWPSVGFAKLTPATVGVAFSPPPATLTDQLHDFFIAGNTEPRPAGDAQAARLAGILDDWTRSVTVVNTVTGSPSLPAINLS
jgi:hypothetical protein